MMKHLLSLFLAMALLTLPLAVLAEEAPAADPADADESLWDASRFITEATDDNEGLVLGVESDPVPITVGAFLDRLTDAISAVYTTEDGDLSLTTFGPYWSDGAWVRVLPFNELVMLIRGATAEADAALLSIEISGARTEDQADEVLDLATTAFIALPEMSQMTQTTMFMLSFNGSASVSFEAENPLWTENGWSLTLRQKTFSCLADIAWTGEPVDAEPPYSLEDLAAIETSDWIETEIPGLTKAAFESRMKKLCRMFGLSFPSEPWETADDISEGLITYIYDISDSTLLYLFCESEGKYAPVLYITAVNLYGDANSAWGTAIAAYGAALGAGIDLLYPLSLLAGSNGGYDELSEMDPYACVDGVILYVYEEEFEELDGIMALWSDIFALPPTDQAVPADAAP